MESLAVWVQHAGPLTEFDAVGWAIRLAKYVEGIAAAGRSHGALSAEAVLTQQVRCTGLGEVCEPERSRRVPAYGSPERGEDDRGSLADDTWAVAVLLYTMLTTRNPFPGETYQEVQWKILAGPAPPLEAFDIYDKELQGIVASALAPSPSSRTSSISVLRAKLASWRPELGLGDLPALEEPVDEDEKTLVREDRDIQARIEAVLAARTPPPPAPPPKLPPPPPPSLTQPPMALPPPPITALRKEPPSFPAPPLVKSEPPVVRSEPPIARSEPIDDRPLQKPKPDPFAPTRPLSTAPLPLLYGKPREKRGALTIALVVIAAGALGTLGYVLARSPAQPPAPPAPPPPAISATTAPATSASAAAPRPPVTDVGSCVRSLLPEDTFDPDAKVDFDFVCTENDPRRGTGAIKKKVVLAGRGSRVSDGMREWAMLGWYEVPAYVVLRATCCESPAPVELPELTGTNCEPFGKVLGDLGAAAASDPGGAAAEDALGRYTRAVYCAFRSGSANLFGPKTPPGGGEDTIFKKTLARAAARAHRE